MLRLDRSTKECSIDGPKESVRLDLKGSDPRAQLTDKARGWEQEQGAPVKLSQQAWSGELAQAKKSQIW